MALKKLQACGEFTLVYEAVMKDGSRRCRLVVIIRDEWPGSHGNNTMRDKVEHLREEVNAVSRSCDEFATQFFIPATLEPLCDEESACPISKHYDPKWHILRGL